MRTSSILLTAALATTLGFAAWQYGELREQRALNQRLATRLEQSAIRARSDAADSRNAAPTSAGPALATATSAPASMPALELQGSRHSEVDWEVEHARLMRDPKYREAFRAQQRFNYVPRRENFIRLLGMTPALADKVIDLQLDVDAQRSELFRAAAETEEARSEQQARVAALERNLQDELRSLLGEDRRARLESYMESRQTRMQVDQFRTQLTEANALRDDQVEPLITALHAERARMLGDMSEFQQALMSKAASDDDWMQRFAERQSELTKSMNERMHSAASSILTSSQLQALDSMLERDYARIEARQHLESVQLDLARAAAAAAASN